MSDQAGIPESPETAATAHDESRTRIAPRSVLVACLLWALPILGEIALLIYVGFMIAWAASVGGPAWDYPIFIGAPLGLISIVFLAIQIPCVLALRRGHRGSRTTLLVLGVLTCVFVMWSTRPFDWRVAWLSVVGLAVVGAMVAAIVLTFTPKANQFARKNGPRAPETGPATTASTTT